jgi:hypothetical protein
MMQYEKHFLNVTTYLPLDGNVLINGFTISFEYPCHPWAKLFFRITIIDKPH